VVPRNRKVRRSVTVDPRDKWQGDTLPEKLRRSLTGEWRSSQRVVAHTVPKNSAGHRLWNGGVFEKSWQFNDMLVKGPAEAEPRFGDSLMTCRSLGTV